MEHDVKFNTYKLIQTFGKKPLSLSFKFKDSFLCKPITFVRLRS